ncbi:MAG: ABC transporter permease [Clostridiaceae bacterium]|nr:ABC transporter permease [Clostridiaceae bacterium]
MSSYKAYLKKEILESKRQYKYIILAAGFLFFAIFEPIMVKLLPEILKSQLTQGSGDISALLPPMTRLTGMQNYIKDLFQILTLVIIFTICGGLSDEITTEKLIFPYSKGSLPLGIVLAKLTNYTLAVTSFTFIGFSINYYYSGLLLKGNAVAFSSVLVAATYLSIYYFYTITIILFFSSIIKKGILTGILVLIINYFSVAFIGIKAISKFIPYKLVEGASQFKNLNLTTTIISVIILSLLFISLTIRRMNKVEVV